MSLLSVLQIVNIQIKSQIIIPLSSNIQVGSFSEKVSHHIHDEVKIWFDDLHLVDIR